MTTFKTNTAKIERVDYLLSECARIGEATHAVSSEYFSFAGHVIIAPHGLLSPD